MRNYIDQALDDIRAQVGAEKSYSWVERRGGFKRRAALLHKAIGAQLTCIFRQQRRIARRAKRKSCGKCSSVISA